MAIELVTGHSGASHVSGADVGAMQAGIVGTGAYVLGDAPTLTLTDANTLSISACELMVNGRHVRLTGTNTVSIQSGSQSGYRNDLVYLRYAMDGDTSVETMELGVQTGETDSSAATDPTLDYEGSILDGGSTVDVAIARVSVDGLTPSAEWLLDAAVPLRGDDYYYDNLDLTSLGYTVSSGNATVRSVTLSRRGSVGILSVSYYVTTAVASGGTITSDVFDVVAASMGIASLCGQAATYRGTAVGVSNNPNNVRVAGSTWAASSAIDLRYVVLF